MNDTLPRRIKAGLVLAVLLSLVDIVALGGLAGEDDPDTNGPPTGVLVAGAILGVATLVAVFIAWRTQSATALRAVAGTRVISALLAVPAFFADDVPTVFIVAAAVMLVLAFVCVALLLSRPTGVAATESDPAGRISS